jgi:signal transduction histidine kinase
VRCHVGELNQAVLNIVVNAAHAIGDVVQGTNTKGRIRVQTARDGDEVVIAIADTGPGIPEDVRGRIFDPFFTTKQVGRGSGQGLAIAHSVIVDKHHGRIGFETELGKGTTFTIRLAIEGSQRAPSADAA